MIKFTAKYVGRCTLHDTRLTGCADFFPDHSGDVAGFVLEVGTLECPGDPNKRTCYIDETLKHWEIVPL